MRNFTASFLGALLAIIAGLSLYHFTVLRPAQELAQTERAAEQMERAKERSERESLKQDMKSAQKHASEERGPLDAPDGPRNALSSIDAQWAMLGEGFGAASRMKPAMVEFYQTEGRWPSSNADLQLPAPDHYRGQSLKSIAILPNSVIEMTFDAKSGVEGGRIRFIPDLAREDAMGVQWRCETSDYREIEKTIPSCQYIEASAGKPTIAQ